MTPLQSANEYAGKAEEYASIGDVSSACTAHFKAAELFLLAMNDTQDPEVLIFYEAVKTLKLLYASHTRLGKDMQRKLNSPSITRKSAAKEILAAETDNKTNKKAIHLYTNQKISISSSFNEDMGSQQFFVGQPSDSKSNNNFRLNQNEGKNESTGPGPATIPISPSESSFDQSYLILGDDDLGEEIYNPDDPFDKFWDAVEGLVQKISGPVAFTTAPLGPTDSIAKNNLNDGSKDSSRTNISQNSMLQSYMIVPSTPGHQSLQNIESSKNGSASVKELEDENAQLRRTIDSLLRKISELETAQKENSMLRSSIIEFKENLQKQVIFINKRAQNHQLYSPTNLQAPKSNQNLRDMVPGITRPNMSMSFHRTPERKSEQESRRIQYLEQELRKANEMNAAHVKRWEKLKESAKKKRDSKSAMSQSSTPEAEPQKPQSPTVSESAIEYFQDFDTSQSAKILVTGETGSGNSFFNGGKSTTIAKWAEAWKLPIITISLIELASKYPQNYEFGIFEIFCNVKNNTVIHVESLEGLFPVSQETFRSQYYDALNFGFQNAARKHNIILIGECCEQDLLNKKLNTFFDYYCRIEIDSKLIQQSLQKYSDGQELPQGDMEKIMDNVSRFNFHDLKTITEAISTELTDDVLSHIPMKMNPIDQRIDVKTWSDIGGYKSIRKELEKGILWPFLKQDMFIKYNIRPSRGTLLYGPPGCGKTLIAKCLAGEAGASFYAVSIPDLVKGEVGESEKAVESLFRIAEKNQPAIIFIDEIESLFSKRQSSNEISSKLYSQLVTELDMLENYSKIVILAATNYIEDIDESLLRSGRIDRIIHVPPPSKSDREDIIYMLISKSKLSCEFSVEEAVLMTSGFSGATLKECFRKASLLAMERYEEIGTLPSISNLDFQSAIKLCK